MQKSNNSLLSRARAFATHHRILCITLATIGFAYLITRLFFTPPLLADIHFSRAYYDRNGELLRITLTPDDKYRIYTPLSEISPHVQRATILYEDKYFRWHAGINPIALIRATKNYFNGAPHPAGASTITMQVARLKYNLDTTRPVGKLIQIAAAIYIDAFYSKDEILTTYLNLAPYGANLEGIGAASLVYFDTPANNLSKIQSITLATIPQNPTKRSLNTTRGASNMIKMRHNLVRRWVAQHPSDSALIQMTDMPLSSRTSRDLPFRAPHFTDAQIAQTNHWSELGNRNSHVTTTLDIKLQDKMSRTLKSQIARRKSVGVTNASAILINYKTMETLAYIGSADYFDKSIYGENDGIRARRSPGSTLKPLIYAAATDRGLIHGMTLLKDAKINFGVYAPENADNDFYGPVLAHTALTHSRNVPAINLVRQIGITNFHKLLTDCGVDITHTPTHYGVSIALGGAEVSMHELARIYATMANLGLHQEIKTTIPTQTTHTPSQILSPEAFFLTLDMLAHQSAPTTHIPFATASGPKLRHYWKTGTSSSYRDAWTAGIFGDYVMVVWVGNFDGRPNNAFSGAKTAAPIYFALADTIIEYDTARGHAPKNNNFYRDDLNVSQIDMCDTVGGLAGTHCPHVIKSYFIPGVSPIDASTIYRAVAIDNKTGLRACHPNPDTTHMAVFEFWDSEYLDMFHRAGITRNTPPPFMAGCDLDEIKNTRQPPVITSPIADTKTVIVRNTDTEPVSFMATSDIADATIFWFLNEQIIGTTTSGQILQHNVPIGDHSVRAVDELGAVSTIKFSVVN